tara:strand:+ start:45 stop:782 length:738 start_codon:yes stop_codon:yes gene_type:complete
MNNKTHLILALTVILSFSVTKSAYAQWAVIDPANLVQNVTTALQTAKQYERQYKQLYEQIQMNVRLAQQLQNDATNMKKDPLEIYRTIRADYEQLQRLLENARIDYANVARVSQQHEAIFGNNPNFESLPDREHYEGFRKSIEMASRQSQEAIDLLKQAELQEKNRAIVADAQKSADTADGYLQVQQAASKIQTASFNTLDNISNYMAKDLEMYATANAIEQREKKGASIKKNMFLCGEPTCEWD